MKHIKLFEGFNTELNTVEKVIRELGNRGNMKGPLAKFVFDNAKRFGINPKNIKTIADFPEKIADLIGYYLMDGEDFWNDWVKYSK